MSPGIKQKSSKLSADKLLYREIDKKHSFSKEEEVYVGKSLQQWLKKGEEIDLAFSRVSGAYCTVTTKGKHKRRVFLKKIKDKWHFLYDAKSLIKDWELNDSKRFKKFDSDDTSVYLHLAISYYLEAHDDKKCLQSLEKFVKNNPDARGKNVAKTIEDNAWLFIFPVAGFVSFEECYLNMGMLEEFAMVNTGYANCRFANKEYRKAFSGSGYLMLGEFKKAALAFKDLANKEREIILNGGLGIFYFEDYMFRYFWALGMYKWKENKKEEAESAFLKAGMLIRTDQPAMKLIDYLLDRLESNKNIESMSSQIALFNKWKKESEVKRELEIDYISDELIVIIKGGLVEEFKVKEVFFARFVRLAVARKVNEHNRGGSIYKYDMDEDDVTNTKNFNLYIGGFRQKNKKIREEQDRRKKRDEELYELRRFLEGCKINRLNEEAKKKLIQSRRGHATVRLEILPENIRINIENIKKFKSRLQSVQPDIYGIRPSKITEQLIKDAYQAYENPSHTTPEPTHFA